MAAAKNLYASVSASATTSAFVSKAQADHGVIRDQLFAGDGILTTHSKYIDYNLEANKLAHEIERYMPGYAEKLVTEYKVLKTVDDLDFLVFADKSKVNLFFADKGDRLNVTLQLSATHLPGIDQYPALAIGLQGGRHEGDAGHLSVSSLNTFQREHSHPEHIALFARDIQDMTASYRTFSEAGRLSTHSERLKLGIVAIYPVNADYGAGGGGSLPSSQLEAMEAAAPGAAHAYLHLRGPQTYAVDGRLDPSDNPHDPYARRLNAEECILAWGLPVSTFADGRVVLDPAGPTDPRSDAGQRAFLIEHYREILEHSGAALNSEILLAQERYRQYGRNADEMALGIKWDRSENFTVNVKMTDALSDVLYGAGFAPAMSVDGRLWRPYGARANHQNLHTGLSRAGWDVTHSGQVPDAMKAVLAPGKVLSPPAGLLTPAERRQTEQPGRRIGR
jgi:hypothetical protein